MSPAGRGCFPYFRPKLLWKSSTLPPDETPGRPSGFCGQSRHPTATRAGRGVCGGAAGPLGCRLPRVSASPIKARLIKCSRLRVGVVANPRDAAAGSAIRIFPQVQLQRAAEDPFPDALGRSRAQPPAPRAALPLSPRRAPPAPRSFRPLLSDGPARLPAAPRAPPRARISARGAPLGGGTERQSFATICRAPGLVLSAPKRSEPRAGRTGSTRSARRNLRAPTPPVPAAPAPRSPTPHPWPLGAAAVRLCASFPARSLSAMSDGRGDRDAARWDFPKESRRTTERSQLDGGPLKSAFPPAGGSRGRPQLHHALRPPALPAPRGITELRVPPRGVPAPFSAETCGRIGAHGMPRSPSGPRRAIPGPGTAPSRAPHGVAPLPPDPRGRPFPWRRAAARVGTTASESGGAEPIRAARICAPPPPRAPRPAVPPLSATSAASSFSNDLLIVG